MSDENLQQLYASEINFRISSFWDCGFDIAIGDDLNGWLAEDNVRTWAEVGPRLAEMARAFFPEFAKAYPGPVAAIEGDPDRIRRERQLPFDAVYPNSPETALDAFEGESDKIQAARATLRQRRNQ